MRTDRLKGFLALMAVCAAGLASGRLLARPSVPRFQLGDWPRRGSGPRLVEYFDPRCSASRAVHLRLEELLGERPRVEHVLVPVAVSRGSGPAPADFLCAMDGPAAFAHARAWAEAGDPRASLAGRRVDERTVACADLVEQATRHTQLLGPDGIPQAPIVDFGGRIYAGRDALPALEATLRETSP